MDQRLCYNLSGQLKVEEKAVKKQIQDKIEELLSKEFYCSPMDLKKEATVYSINIHAERPYIKIMAYRTCVVVCSSENLHSQIREVLRHKTRDEIFELPFVYGQTIHYVPDGGCTEEVCISSDYKCESLFGRDILTLAGLTGFENSLAFDENGCTPAKAVCIARNSNRITGVAGASESPVDGVWEIGVDVMEECRNAGLGTYLVRKLTRALLARGIVPFYSASVTNIGSQMVAARCKYIPCWVDTFGTTLDGSSAYNRLVTSLSL